MKCKNLIEWKAYTKSGKTIQRKKQVYYPRWISDPNWNRKELDKAIASGAKITECGGDIKVTIDVENAGECRCDGQAICIEYECSNCNEKYYPEFPDKYNIQEWVQNYIRNVSNEEYNQATQNIISSGNQNTKAADLV